jgi:putative two-component system protein, hydrogenase maturation factor HypX/HoxX
MTGLPRDPYEGQSLTGSYMRILLLSSAYNSLTQRVHAELADGGHDVSVELALGDEAMREALRRHEPDLIIAPMLTTAIPADVWSARP